MKTTPTVQHSAASRQTTYTTNTRPMQLRSYEKGNSIGQKKLHNSTTPSHCRRPHQMTHNASSRQKLGYMLCLNKTFMTYGLSIDRRHEKKHITGPPVLIGRSMHVMFRLCHYLPISLLCAYERTEIIKVGRPGAVDVARCSIKMHACMTPGLVRCCW